MFESEQIFVEHMEAKGKALSYIPISFKLSKGTYRPDFYCPDDDTFYEVDAGTTAYYKKDKLNLFENEYPDIKFKVVTPGGQEIPKVGGRYFLSRTKMDKSWKEKLPTNKSLFFGFLVSNELYQKIASMAKKQSRSVSSMVRVLIKKELKEIKEEEIEETN